MAYRFLFAPHVPRSPRAPSPPPLTPTCPPLALTGGASLGSTPAEPLPTTFSLVPQRRAGPFPPFGRGSRAARPPARDAERICILRGVRRSGGRVSSVASNAALLLSSVLLTNVVRSQSVGRGPEEEGISGRVRAEAVPAAIAVLPPPLLLSTYLPSDGE